MYVIKRDGRKEKFSKEKIVESVCNACLSSGMDVKGSVKISQQVLREIKKTLPRKGEVKSTVIFNKIRKVLGKHSEECAFMYETHRDVS